LPDRVARLFPRLPPGFQGYRAADQGGSFPRIQLAVEAKPQVTAAMPPDYRRPTERAAVQYHRRSNRQACRTIELRTGGRQVEELDSVTLSVCLKKRRQRHRHARIDAAVLIRRMVLRRCGVCHVASGLAEGCCQSMNAECQQWVESRRRTLVDRSRSRTIATRGRLSQPDKMAVDPMTADEFRDYRSRLDRTQPQLAVWARARSSHRPVRARRKTYRRNMAQSAWPTGTRTED
jgi:hypothetical protein